MTSIKRTRTNHKGIYFNESTHLYDVKICYSVYNSDIDKTMYKQKWKYNCPTISDARETLLQLRSEYIKPRNTGVTLKDALSLWEAKAAAQNLSPVTVQNTRAQFKIICRVLPANTCISDITEDIYYDFILKCRNLGYGEESISIINGSLRKLINLCYRKKLIADNILDYCDSIKTAKKEDYKTISKKAYDRIDEYFTKSTFPHSNPEYVVKYRFLFSLLYYTGIRIGEALALTYDDFEDCVFFLNGAQVSGMRLMVSKAYIQSLRIIKEPKNYKIRAIPLADRPIRLYKRAKKKHIDNGGLSSDRIFTMTYSPIDKALKRACRTLNLPPYHCHEFRHTYISYLISKNVPISIIEKVTGDTQQTILSRYSHCFNDAESVVWQAVRSL